MDPHTALEAWRSLVGKGRLEPMAKAHNPLWRVIADDGREWVLKRLPEYPPGVGPVEEYRVLCYLQSAGLPVATPVITDDGLIVFNADDLHVDPARKRATGRDAYALIPMLPNDLELQESPELANTIGAGIGRLDRALAECPWPVRSFVDDPAHQILQERYPSLPDEVRALTNPLWDRLYAVTVDLPRQRNHGDCTIGNVLVHDGAVTGFIDLDHLPTGPRTYDLSKYLVSRLSAHIEHGDPDAMVTVMGQYIAGYLGFQTVSERELASMVPLMVTIAMGEADWHLHSRAPEPDAYQQDLRIIRRLTRQYDELAAVMPTCTGGSYTA